MYRLSVALVTLVTLATPRIAPAQLFVSGDSGPRQLLPRVREIALARSAAPSAIADSAAVYVLTTNGYELAVPGSSGAACYVSRDWRNSIEPHCFDPEGAATIMQMNMRKVELLHAGLSLEQASDSVTADLMRGTFRLPRRPAASWMMSAAQKLVSDDGQAVGAWKPHVMIYYPFLDASDIGLADESIYTSTMISGAGGPLSTLIVIVPDFVEPDTTRETTP